MNGSPRIRVVASFPQQRFERALSLDRSSSIVIVVASRVGYRRRLIFRISLVVFATNSRYLQRLPIFLIIRLEYEGNCLSDKEKWYGDRQGLWKGYVIIDRFLS